MPRQTDEYLATLTENTQQYIAKLEAEVKRLEAQAERLWRQRTAYRRVAIEWFNSDGPAPENFSDEDVVASVDALAEEDRRNGLELAESEIAGRDQQIERLFGRTADGVLITLGMTVWVITNKIATKHVVRLIEIAEEGCWVSWGWTRDAYRSELLHSTLASAVEAIMRGKEKGDS